MPDTDRSLVPVEGGLWASLTIDNISVSDGHRLNHLLDWLAERDVRATFFLIPYSFQNQAPIYEDAELIAAIQRGLAEGHEFCPHGYDHELFECGIPDPLALRDPAMQKRVARTLSREMFQLVHHHARGKIATTLERSVRIFREVFGPDFKPSGFRAGYHAFCRGLYFALEDLKFTWSSTRTASPSAWRTELGPESDEIVSWVGLQPYRVGDIIEIPHLANYGYHLSPDAIEVWVNLAKRHLRHCAKEKAPFVAVAQHGGLRCSGDPEGWRDGGYMAYDQIIDIARNDFGCRFATLGAIAAQAQEKREVWPQRDEYKR